MGRGRHRLLVISPIPPELRARLGARFELVGYDGHEGGDVSGYAVAVTTSVGGISNELMAAMSDLRLIACNGTGLENIDVEAAASRGVAVQNTPDVVTEDTADFAIGLMYAVCRRIAEGDRFVRSGRWARERMTPSRRLYDKTVGIVGLGKIGSAIARRATGIGMTVSYTGPREKPGSGYAFYPNISSMAERVDFLVLSCPGGQKTRHIVDAGVLVKLGPEGMLINVSRGSVVDEEALVAALEAGSIAAAGLDVYASEPGIDPRFFAFENVVLEPHYAAVTRETRLAMADILERAIDDLLSGREPVSTDAAGG